MGLVFMSSGEARTRPEARFVCVSRVCTRILKSSQARTRIQARIFQCEPSLHMASLAHRARLTPLGFMLTSPIIACPAWTRGVLLWAHSSYLSWIYVDFYAWAHQLFLLYCFMTYLLWINIRLPPRYRLSWSFTVWFDHYWLVLTLIYINHESSELISLICYDDELCHY